MGSTVKPVSLLGLCLPDHPSRWLMLFQATVFHIHGQSRQTSMAMCTSSTVKPVSLLGLCLPDHPSRKMDQTSMINIVLVSMTMSICLPLLVRRHLLENGIEKV